jgi:hypothetical protein
MLFKVAIAPYTDRLSKGRKQSGYDDEFKRESLEYMSTARDFTAFG